MSDISPALLPLSQTVTVEATVKTHHEQKELSPGTLIVRLTVYSLNQRSRQFCIYEYRQILKTDRNRGNIEWSQSLDDTRIRAALQMYRCLCCRVVSCSPPTYVYRVRLPLREVSKVGLGEPVMAVMQAPFIELAPFRSDK